MVEAFSRALEQVFTRPFRSVLFRSLALVILLFVVLGAIAQALIFSFDFAFFGLGTALAVFAGAGLLFGAWFLLVPITMIVAGVFLEDIAATVEAKYYPHDRPGRNMPMAKGLSIALRFTLIVVAVNIVLLPTLLIPGLGQIVYFVANAYLIGREYMELVALRHLSYADARSLRRAHRSTVWIAGAIVTLLLMIPFVNLLVPLFATAFMVHIFKQIAAEGSPRDLEVMPSA